MSWRYLFGVWVVAALLGVPGGLRAQLPALPLPSEHGSHEPRVEALAAAEQRVFDYLLDEYDQQIAQAPGDVVAHVERCKFVTAALSERDFEGSRQELAQTCVQDLESQFPLEPKAAGYVLEHKWGDEAIAYGRRVLADKRIRWSPQQRARAEIALARALSGQGQVAEAGRLAERAVRRFPAAEDAVVLIATHELAAGRPQKAVHWLQWRLDQDLSTSELDARAGLLVEAESHELAWTVLERLRQHPDTTFVNRRQRMQVLIALGRTQEARLEVEAIEEPHLRATVLQEVFELELKSGNARRTLAAYDELRALGFESDPLLYHRLRVFFRHPGEAWAARDLWGVLTWLALLLFLACLPGLWMLPVHYAGLVRRSRRPDDPSPFMGWSIRRTWGLCSAVLVADIVVAFAVYYDLLHHYLFASDWEPEPAAKGTAAAYMLVLTTGAGLALMAAFMRRPDWQAVLKPAEGAWQSARRVSKAMGLAVLVSVGNFAIARALGIAPGSSDGSATVSTAALLTASGEVLGLGGLWLLAALAVPVVEELLFRYALAEGFARHVSAKWANRLQAGLFAVAHDAVIFWPTLFALGFMAGKLRHRTGALWASIALHALWNTLAVLRIKLES